VTDPVREADEFESERRRAAEIGGRVLVDRLYHIPTKSERDAETIILVARLLIDYEAAQAKLAAPADGKPNPREVGVLLANIAEAEGDAGTIIRLIDAFRAAGVAAERERCAGEADFRERQMRPSAEQSNYSNGYADAAKHIAAAIRDLNT
jgi:hypothetical protein